MPSRLYRWRVGKIEDTFLLASGKRESWETGGEEYHVLAKSEMPQHNHDFSGNSGTTQIESSSHTHSGTTSKESTTHTHTATVSRTDITHTHTIPSLTGTAEQSGDHKHGYVNLVHGTTAYAGSRTDGVAAAGQANQKLNYEISYTTSTDGAHTHTVKTNSGSTNPNASMHDHEVTINANKASHDHEYTTGNESNRHTHAFTPEGSISYEGDSTGHNNMPPYYVVHVWKRVA